jgi:hypothetical protein
MKLSISLALCLLIITTCINHVESAIDNKNMPSKKELYRDIKAEPNFIYESVIYLGREENRDMKNPYSDLYIWCCQLPVDTIIRDETDISVEIGGVPKNLVLKPYSEFKELFPNNFEQTNVWYSIPDEVISIKSLRIDKQITDYKHIYFRYKLPPKTDVKIKVKYEYIPKSDILNSKDFGLRLEYSFDNILPFSDPSNTSLKISIESFANYFIEKTNYLDYRKEYTSNEVDFVFDPPVSLKIHEPMKVCLASKNISTFIFIRGLSLIFSISLLMLIIARVFFIKRLRHSRTIRIVIKSFLGGISVILLLFFVIYGKSGSIMFIKYTLIYITILLAIIAIFVCKRNLLT